MATFNGRNVKVIDFLENTELETNENKLFPITKNKFVDFDGPGFGIYISSFIIPSRVKEFKPGWNSISKL